MLNSVKSHRNRSTITLSRHNSFFQIQLNCISSTSRPFKILFFWINLLIDYDTQALWKGVTQPNVMHLHLRLQLQVVSHIILTL